MICPTFVLGARDPEMGRIVALLHAARAPVAYAMADGRRCNADNAYRADTAKVEGGGAVDMEHVVTVECQVPSLPAHSHVDHHHAGDHGYHVPPKAFLDGSSLGQVLAVLVAWQAVPAVIPSRGIELSYRPGTFWLEDGFWYLAGQNQPASRHWAGEWQRAYELPDEFVFAAAADHCLLAAYAGQCPGVDPDALLRWRIKERAEERHVPACAVARDVRVARKVLAGTPDVHDLPGVRDLCGVDVPEAAEAAARDGIALMTQSSTDDGRRQIMLHFATAEILSVWWEWSKAHRLVDPFGDDPHAPVGGYLPR